MDKLVEVKCDICHATEYETIYASKIKKDLKASDFTVFDTSQEYHRIVRCCKCGLVYASPRDGADELSHHYSKMSVNEYLIEQDSRELIFKKDAKIVMQYCQSGDVLDIGCSAGIFLSQLNKNFNLHGIEPSAAAFKIAQKRLPEADIINGVLAEQPFKNKKFDVITMWDVIEHLPHPSRDLRIVNRCLKDNGLLFLVTPKFDGMMSKIMRSHWTHLIRGHVTYFEKKTITAILERNNFEVVAIKSYTRIFKISYILKRLGMEKLSGFVKNNLAIFDIRIPINLDDSMMVIAKKKQ